MSIINSVCPYDCPDACGLLIHTENGKVVKVAGNPEHSFTRGTLCAKMSHYERTIYSERRLSTPLKRSGPKGSGEFTPISWSEAISIIADNWKSIQREYSSEAILPYSYAGTMGLIQHDAYHALFHSLGASRLARTICAPAKSDGWRAVMGDTLPTAPQEAQHSDLIILWSLNMLATDVHFKHDVDIAKKRGAKIYCIDTYESATAQICDKFIRVNPGTDGALALGLMHVIDRENLTDNNFISEYVQGWQKLKSDILPKYSPKIVEDITGVDEVTLTELATAYAKARAPFIRLGSGMSRYTNGAMSSRLIVCLPAIVGAYAKVGGGMLTSASGSKAFNKNIMQRSEFLTKNTRIINMCEIGKKLLETDNPPIKSLYVYSSNPACTAPNQNLVIKGLLREDLFTVVHERFMTDTARYADIILPATTSLEHNDVYYSYGHYTVGVGRKIIEPIGESKSNWNVSRLLAEAMNLSDPFFKKSEDELVSEIINNIKWPLPIDVNKLSSGLPIDLPMPDNYKMTFATPSGKIEILSPNRQIQLPDYFAAEFDDTDFKFINPPDVRVLDSSFNERKELTRGKIMILMINPNDAAALNLSDGETVVAYNERGEASFTVKISNKTARGYLVSEGVWWREHVKDNSLNVLTSDRLTDEVGGSTFYGVGVNLRKLQ